MARLLVESWRRVEQRACRCDLRSGRDWLTRRVPSRDRTLFNNGGAAPKETKKKAGAPNVRFDGFTVAAAPLCSASTLLRSCLARLPYGGYKQSGLGRELGRAGLDAFLETKSVHIKLA
jgi:Aldehyde dehydrogenase family